MDQTRAEKPRARDHGQSAGPVCRKHPRQNQPGLCPARTYRDTIRLTARPDPLEMA